MSCFDDVAIKIKCPLCGAVVEGFQSKDGECLMQVVDFGHLSNFYSDCPKCGAWLEFNRKETAPSPITDYELWVTKKGRKPKRIDGADVAVIGEKKK